MNPSIPGIGPLAQKGQWDSVRPFYKYFIPYGILNK